MNQPTSSAILAKLLPVGVCALAVLLCSCAATSVKQTWKSPDCPGPVGKIAVITIEERGIVREGFENRFVKQLTGGGASAVPTYDQLSLPEIKRDKEAAAARLRASGAEVVLIMRLAMADSSYREIQPGGERYAATLTGFETTGWYDYYSVGFMSLSPTYGSLTQRVYLETRLFDLKTEKLLWSGVTLTVVKETLDRVAEMDPLVSKIILAMRKDGVVR